jgi:hypothetical protein
MWNRKKIENAKRLVRHFHRKACQHDRLNPDGIFSVFSEGNPFVPHRDRAFKVYFALVAVGVGK